MKRENVGIKLNKTPQTLAAVHTHTHTHTHLTTRGKKDAIFASKNIVKKTIYEKIS